MCEKSLKGDISKNLSSAYYLMGEKKLFYSLLHIVLYFKKSGTARVLLFFFLIRIYIKPPDWPYFCTWENKPQRDWVGPGGARLEPGSIYAFNYYTCIVLQ